MDGTCDVPGCTSETYMGWRPLTEPKGKQVCEYHWRRHLDPQDSFNLFEAFGFRRPTGIRKPVAKKDVPRCACGGERLPGRRLCTICAEQRERDRKKRAYHERKNRPKPVPGKTGPVLRCRTCGAGREAGHTYCQRCAERRKKTSHRRRQSRYWKKQHSCTGSN